MTINRRSRRRLFERSLPDSSVDHLLGPGSGLYGYEMLEPQDGCFSHGKGNRLKRWVASEDGLRLAAECRRCTIILPIEDLDGRRFCIDCRKGDALYELWRHVDSLAERLKRAQEEIARNDRYERMRARTEFQSAWNKAWTDRNDELMSALAGYSTGELRRHLERQFVSGMCWDNYGMSRGSGKRHPKRRRYWHIDHIVPKSSFDGGEQKSAYALTNLRPLWERENYAKGAKRLHLV